ncbi:MAG: glycosyltransferase [Pseudomonadota bacterium]
MARHQSQLRVLMYSHDTFGLGHLRRTRAIAHALVEQHKGLTVLIICGSSVAGAFDFKARVDFVKIPSVIKLHNGEYKSLTDLIDLGETLNMRRAIIESTAISFQPDVFIVDKEPRGLRRELDSTLPILQDQGCHIVLGLREVLDEPEVVCAEWQRNAAMTWVREYFDSIWIYGSKDFWNPLEGLELPETVTSRVKYTGFLARTIPKANHSLPRKLPNNYILVTAGGGGDGGDLMRQVLAAKEHDKANRFPFVLVLGPFMPLREKAEIRHRANRIQDMHVLDFDNRIETLMQKATAVVSMGGYNTFCELLSFDKRSLIVPRKTPRREQLIRAQRAAAFGLLDLIDPDDAKDPWQMAGAISALPSRKPPSRSRYRVDLNGLQAIGKMVGKLGRNDRRVPPQSASVSAR